MRQIIGDIITILNLLIIAILLLGLPLMFLWNWLMPVIFGLPEITFWQACGLQILSTLLFSNIIQTKK